MESGSENSLWTLYIEALDIFSFFSGVGRTLNISEKQNRDKEKILKKSEETLKNRTKELTKALELSELKLTKELNNSNSLKRKYEELEVNQKDLVLELATLSEALTFVKEEFTKEVPAEVSTILNKSDSGKSLSKVNGIVVQQIILKVEQMSKTISSISDQQKGLEAKIKSQELLSENFKSVTENLKAATKNSYEIVRTLNQKYNKLLRENTYLKQSRVAVQK